MLKYLAAIGVLVGALALFLGQSSLLMPMGANLMAVVLLVVAYVAYTALFWKEKPRDEREEVHVNVSGRVSFLVGITVLTVAVIVQSFMHDIDPWVIGALIVMVVGKMVSRLYSDMKM